MIRPANLLHLTLSMGAGGIENLILTMARHIDQTRFNMTVGCLDSGGVLLDEVKNMGIDTFVLSRKGGYDVRLILNLARILKKRKIHILNTHNQAAHFYGCLAGLLAGTSVIINTEHSRHYIDEHWRRRLEKRMLSFCTDRIVAVSKELQKKSIIRDKLPEKKVEVVENGIDLSLYMDDGGIKDYSTKSKLVHEFGMPQEYKIVGIIGRLHPVKNHELLFKSIRSLIVDQKKIVSLLVVGDGELRTTLEKLAMTLGIGNKVYFTGYRQDIPDILSILDALVLCSHSEGLPLTLLEAMAAGVPVIVTHGANKGGIVHDQVNGLIADSTVASLTAMLSRALNGEFSEKLIKQARELVFHKFDITATVERYHRLYTDILTRKRQTDNH